MIQGIDVIHPRSGVVTVTIAERNGFIQAWVVPSKRSPGEKAGLELIELLMESCKNRYIPFRDYQRKHLSRRKGRTYFSDRLSIPGSYRKKFGRLLDSVLKPIDERTSKPIKPKAKPKIRKTHLRLVPKPPAAE